mmetsp:Transcript_37482/g.52845  ORF Transcript_37482/g.52845 Transcript_37482/m.52845 type:complete len:477 (+) Transcript_37482:25-1455(+)
MGISRMIGRTCLVLLVSLKCFQSFQFFLRTTTYRNRGIINHSSVSLVDPSKRFLDGQAFYASSIVRNSNAANTRNEMMVLMMMMKKKKNMDDVDLDLNLNLDDDNTHDDISMCQKKSTDNKLSETAPNVQFIGRTWISCFTFFALLFFGVPDNSHILPADTIIQHQHRHHPIRQKIQSFIQPPSVYALDTKPNIKIDTTQATTTTPTIATKTLPKAGTVMDLSGVIDKKSRRSMEKTIQSVQNDITGAQIQVLFVDDVQNGYSPKSMATFLFRKWNLDPDNGVLVLAVRGQRRIEIQVGRGLGSYYFSQDWCRRTLQETAISPFKAEQYGPGLTRTVDRVARRLREANSYTTKFMGSLESYTLPVFLVWAFGYQLYMDARPLRIPCPSCQAGPNTWAYDTDGWVITTAATDMNAGEKIKLATCSKCGQKETARLVIPKFDARREYDDGTIKYYNYRSDSSDGGDGDSGGDGGGADW